MAHLNSSQGESTEEPLKISADLALEKEASHLAQQLFGNEIKKCRDFTNRLLDICTEAQGRDFILIHSPGGWGNRFIKERIVSSLAEIKEVLDALWLHFLG